MTGGRTARLRRLLVAVTVASVAAIGANHAVATPTGAPPTQVEGRGLGADFHPATNSYDDEPDLAPDRLSGSGFGAAWTFPKGGTSLGQIYAKPVLARGTLVVATETNVVHGLDPHTGVERWRLPLGTPFNPRTVSPYAPCGDISPFVGTTSTPVVGDDGTVYLTSKIDKGPAGTPAYYLHALDPATGAERPHYPVLLGGTADNAPGVAFNARVENQRAGLLLLDGVVYLAFGSHCDYGPYRGWILGVRVADGTVTARWTTETEAVGPSGHLSPEAGIWQGGAPLVGDGGNGFYFTSGNGDVPTTPTPGSAAPGQLGEVVGHMTVGTDGKLHVGDFFIPSAAEGFLNKYDEDLGSGGPTLLPGAFGTPQHPSLLVVGGKSGDLWLLDQKNLGGFRQGVGGVDAAVSRTTVPAKEVLFGKIAAWAGPVGQRYVYVRVGGTPRAYLVAPDGTGAPRLVEAGHDAGGAVALAGSPLVTSTGAEPDSAVVWTEWMPTNNGTGAQLRAYGAVPAADGTLPLLWSAPIGTAAKFQSPTVIDGWVYTAGRDGIVRAFHNPATVPVTARGGDAGQVPQGTTTTGALTLTALTPVTVTALTPGGSADFTVTPPALPATLPAGGTLTVPWSFTPSAVGGRSATVAVGTGAGTVTLPLSGVGTYPAGHLSVSPTLDVGDYPVTTPAPDPVTRALTLENDGATNLTIRYLQKPGSPFTVTGVPNGTVIAPAGRVAVPISFHSTTIGEYAGSLAIGWGSSDVTYVGLTARAVAPPHFTFAPAPTGDDEVAHVDFGTVAVGSSASGSFTVTNDGGAPGTVTLSKPPDEPGLTYSNLLPEGTVLQPGQSITVPLTWRPRSAGTLDADWLLNSTGSGKVTVGVGGTATG